MLVWMPIVIKGEFPSWSGSGGSQARVELSLDTTEGEWYGGDIKPLWGAREYSIHFSLEADMLAGFCADLVQLHDKSVGEVYLFDSDQNLPLGLTSAADEHVRMFGRWTFLDSLWPYPGPHREPEPERPTGFWARRPLRRSARAGRSVGATAAAPRSPQPYGANRPSTSQHRPRCLQTERPANGR